MEYKLASSTWDNKEIEAIHRVIESDHYSMGNMVKSYEEDFAKYFNSKFAVMTSSGSTANLLMIAAMFFTNDSNRRFSRGDEIIVPAVSWSTTYFPLQQYGLKLVFVDIDKETLNIDLNKLKRAITLNTKAILGVNLLGNPIDFDELNTILDGKNITILEDNCESLGASYNEKYAGTFGLMGTFSSFFSHHISTMEGGCILTEDEEIYHILLSLRAHGWTRNLPDTNHVTGIKSKNNFEELFKFVLPGYNVRPLEFSGAIGIEQLKKLPSFINIRRENAKYFNGYFESHPYIQIQKETSKSSWFGFALILKKNSPVNRHEFVKKLEEARIECRPIVSGNFLNNKEVLKYFDYEIFESVENAEYIDKNGLFIGNHQNLLDKEIAYLADIVTNIFTSK